MLKHLYTLCAFFKSQQNHFLYGDNTKINSIYLDIAEINNLTIIELLNSAKKIENFLCTGEKVLASNDKIDPEQKFITLRATPCSQEKIKHQVANSTNLVFCNNFNLAEHEKKLSTLLCLKKLTIINSNVESDFLSAILNKAPYLQEIILKNCDNLNAATLNITKQLDSLVCLNITNSNISLESIAKIINMASKLKRITLSHCNNLNTVATRDKLKKLEHLEYLNIFESNINGPNCLQLIHKSPNLKEINLYKCTGLASTTLNNICSLTQLIILDIQACNITIDFLFRIMHETPALHTICLADCKNLNNLSNIPLKNLISLNNLDFRRTNIDPSMFSQILDLALNIKRLDIASCLTLRTAKITNFSKRCYFKTIRITNSTLDVAALALLIKISPELQRKKQLLLDCLYMFKEYHPAIANLAELLVKHHKHSLNEYEINTIFSSKCTEEAKFKLFSLFDESMQDQVHYNCKPLTQSLEARIARVVILGQYVYKNKTFTFDPLVSNKILSFLNPHQEYSALNAVADVINYRYSCNEPARFTNLSYV